VSDSQRILDLTLDERTVVRRNPDIEQERRVAIYDLLQQNHFSPRGAPHGPYRLRLGIEPAGLAFDVRSESDLPLSRIVLALSLFRHIMRDYFIVCDSYYESIKSAPQSRIEAIDMGRRAMHTEAAELLVEKLKDRVELDLDTARRLFTLMCVLHRRA